MRLGFIGTGVMGASMVRNLLKAGFEVNVYNRSPEKAKALVKDGAQFCANIAECIKDVDGVITIVGMPSDVKEVYQAIFKGLKPNSFAIDMTTSSPSLAQELYDEGKKLGIHILDAPVSGGDIGAKNGTLSIMVGGDEEVFLQCRPIFEAMGKTINYIGAAGFGQHTKMVNQILVAGNTVALNEALAYSQKMGLDPETVLKAVSAGAAGSWQLNNNGPKIIKHDDSPGFFIKHFIKDMRLANEEALAKGLKLEVLQEVLAQYEELAAEGLENLGTQALYKRYDK